MPRVRKVWEVPELRDYQSLLPLAGKGRKEKQSRFPHSGLLRRSELFFVIKPPSCMSKQIHDAACRHAVGRTSRIAHPAELLHVSLLLMDEFDEPPYHLVPRIETAIGSIRARPFDIVLDGCALYGNGQHLALTSSNRNSGIQAFVRMLHGALTRHNLPRIALRSLSPHVTIIYGYGRRELMSVKEPYAWPADEFALIYSHNGERRHEEFGRWHFDAEAPPYARPPTQLYLPALSETETRQSRRHDKGRH
jgi:RNA 2',3'-cyclic 3'-phosphodiesterase